MTEQKAKAANQLGVIGEAIHSAADQLRQHGNASTAQYADMAARGLDDLARYVGDQDLRTLVRSVESAARRRPELFLGGMFLVGLGISRFLKASHTRA